MLYPIMLDLKEKTVTIIGGGEVSLRKVKSLLNCGAYIKVISPYFSEGFKEISHEIQLIEDRYREELIKDSFIVICATSSKEVNKEAALYCKRNNILCNIADDGALSDFHIPSVIRRGDLILSVSTSGKSPSLSSKIKNELEEKYTEDYEQLVNILGEIREIILKNFSDSKEKRKILNEIAQLSLEELIEFKDRYGG